NDHGERAELDAIVGVLEREHRKQPGTMLAFGDDSAYVYFRSRVKPAHPRYHWELFFDVPYLPEPAERVIASILDAPPTYLVIDRAQYAAFRERPGELRRARLVHAL